jgi:hypothetical protein
MAAAGLLAIASPLGCSSPPSFIVLVVESSPPAPIAGVAQLTVVVSKGTTEMKTLIYGASDLTLTADADTSSGTLSVSFSGSETGDITFGVTAFDAQGCDVGSGTVTVTIKKGATNEGIVALAPGAGCRPADGGADGGGPDVGGPDAGAAGVDGGGPPFPGCAPASPQCATGQTCQVDCTAQQNECVTGGAMPAGATCQSTADCAPGTQCFDYTSLGCAIKICLRFCGSGADCTTFGAGGPGPGSFCRAPVVCAGGTTAYHSCTFNCDPTASAAPNGGGCPSGLACLMPASMDQVDCACAGPSRTGREGNSCSTSVACAPGLICNAMGGAQSCRPVCRCDANAGSCTAANDCPTAGTHCTPVTNQTLYGICM